MTFPRYRYRTLRNLAVACLLAGLHSGCTVVGPAAVHNGRLAYNEAIIETENQQVLLLAVRNRYGERSNLLAVSSVTANVSVTTSGGVELGFGDSDNYGGNLVPFRAGVIYEENPTISYVPVGGEQYAEQLTSPIPVAAVAQLTSTRVYPELMYSALVARVNGIRNPDFIAPASDPDPRFARFLALMGKLTRAHRLHWIRDPQQASGFSIVIDHHWPEYAREVEELLGLLGLPATRNPESPIVLPVHLAMEGRNGGGIAIVTRSPFDLLQIMTAAVQVPPADQSGGAAAAYPRPGASGENLRVGWSRSRPDHASVAVSYRDTWFSIDDNDQDTKQFFRLLCVLLSMAMHDTTAGRASAPVLTVPVSR